MNHCPLLGASRDPDECGAMMTIYSAQMWGHLVMYHTGFEIWIGVTSWTSSQGSNPVYHFTARSSAEQVCDTREVNRLTFVNLNASSNERIRDGREQYFHSHAAQRSLWWGAALCVASEMWTVIQTIQSNLMLVNSAHFSCRIHRSYIASNDRALTWHLQFGLHIHVGNKMDTLVQDVKEGLRLKPHGSEVR